MIPISRLEFCKKPTLYINLNVLKEIVSLKQYIFWFNLKYPVEKTYNAPFWYKFHSTASKKTFVPNNRITENSYWKHDNIRTSKEQAKTTDSQGTTY